MALLFLDGFDHYGNVGDPFVLGKWGGNNSSLTINTVARTGTYSLRTTNTGSITSKTFIPTSNGIIVGFAIHNTSGSGFVTTNVVEIREGSTVHLAIAFSGSVLTVKLGSTIIATGTKIFAANSWYYIELKAIIHDTTGSYELRIDGATELTATNVDTRNGGATGQWNNILLAGFASTSNSYYDDLYICDTSGSAPTNDFLGAIKVDTLLPQTDAVSIGSNQGLTPSTGTDHGALVDENPPNTTDYNSGSTVGVKDTYQYPNAALTGTIVGIQTNLYVAKSDASARQVAAVVRTNSVDYDGANASPLTTYSYLTEVRALNPNTGVAWTTADINAIQVGMKVTV